MITKIFSTVATFKTILKLSEREVVLYANNCSKWFGKWKNGNSGGNPIQQIASQLCAASDSVCGVSEFCDVENPWQWSRQEIRLVHSLWSTICIIVVNGDLAETRVEFINKGRISLNETLRFSINLIKQ